MVNYLIQKCSPITYTREDSVISKLSYQSRRELVRQMAPRYQEASRARKSVLLDEFVALTGYVRKYAIQLPNHPEEPKPRSRQVRLPHYGPEVQQALFLAWKAANQICAKRLIPFLPTLIEALERHGHLHLIEEYRKQLLSMSATTADRILRSSRQQATHGVSTTRAGTLLKHQIPIRTFQDWNETEPGFLEADLVAHCGIQAEGGYLYTLTLTDITTGWTECLPLLYRSRETVLAAFQCTQKLFPFPILGIDTDNGGEFINEIIVAYCEQEQITFTRGRPYQKRDQCFVEQKNRAIVRKAGGLRSLRWRTCLSATHRTLPGTASVCQLLSAEGVAAIEATEREKSALRLRSSQDATPAAAPVRRPICPEATGTARGSTRARPDPPLPTNRAVAKSRLSLCYQLSSFCFKHPPCPDPLLFSRTLYDGEASRRRERPRSASDVPRLVPRAGAQKTGPGLAACPQRSFCRGVGADHLLGDDQPRTEQR